MNSNAPSFFKLALFAAMCFYLPSCTSKKNLVYFNEASENAVGASSTYNPVLQKDDLLSIIVMGQNPEAALPFNLPVVQQTNAQIGGYTQGAPTPAGYLIDQEGNIDFPFIGKIHLDGLTRSASIDLLKEKLSKYLLNPSINIRILNYKITVLGEVRNPGTFTIPNERVTLPEALGIAGDLLITGKRKNVLVIRDVNGQKIQTRVNLTTNELFSSPMYYLHQNDIVYVEPNKAKINSSVINSSNISVSISVLSLLITIATILTK